MSALGLRQRAEGNAGSGDRLSAPDPRPARAPYPGLASYGDGDDDAELFFGRTRERDLIIANLRAARLTVLYGPSGVGKSSLLHAGVVHRLRIQARPEPGDEDDDQPRTAVVILDDWGGDPVARLAAKIRALIGDDDAAAPRDSAAPDDSARSLLDDAAAPRDSAAPDDSARSLLDAVTAYRGRRRGGLLLILDQFEEYIRLHPDPRKQSFDRIIAQLVRDPQLSVRILIAIRDDRLADLDRFGGRVPQLLGNMLRLGPLSPTAALEAIQGPIERYAAWAREGRSGREVTLEAGLAQAVRDELVTLSGRRGGDLSAGAGDDGGGRKPYVDTAFLQLVMRRLWDEDIAMAGGTTIQLTTLAQLGGADQIVASHLDSALASLSAADQDLAAEMLHFLVTPSGATACLTARDLSEYTERAESEVEALAEKLGRPPARILRAVAAAPDQAGAGGYELPQVLAEPALEWRARRRTVQLEERARRLLLALVTMTAVALALVGYILAPGPLRRLDLTTVDARFDLRGAQPPDSRIALVTLDDAALRRLKAGARPPRATVALALAAIGAADPRAIVSDIIFKGTTSVPADNALINAVRGPLRHRLVLATDWLDVEGKSQLFGRETEIFGDRTVPAVGHAGFPRDPGDVARRIDRDVAVQPGAKTLDTLAVATARVAAGVRGEQLPATAWIAYRGPSGTFPRVAFYDVLLRRPQALAKLRGKIVVLGSSAKAVVAPDVLRTSAPGPSLMDGIEIQANAISTALDRFPLRDGGRTLDLALILGLGLLPLGLALSLRPALVVPAGVVAAALFCVAAQLAFDGGRVISIVYPLASLLLATIGASAVLLRDRRAAPATKARA